MNEPRFYRRDRSDESAPTGRTREYLEPSFDSWETFLLKEGEAKIVSTPDPDRAYTTVFTFNREDDTLGNLLQGLLRSSPLVEFTAYHVPHPLFPVFKLRVSTTPPHTPEDVMVEVCARFRQQLTGVKQSIVREWYLAVEATEARRQNELARRRVEREKEEEERRMRETAERHERHERRAGRRGERESEGVERMASLGHQNADALDYEHGNTAGDLVEFAQDYVGSYGESFGAADVALPDDDPDAWDVPGDNTQYS